MGNLPISVPKTFDIKIEDTPTLQCNTSVTYILLPHSPEPFYAFL